MWIKSYLGIALKFCVPNTRKGLKRGKVNNTQCSVKSNQLAAQTASETFFAEPESIKSLRGVGIAPMSILRNIDK